MAKVNLFLTARLKKATEKLSNMTSLASRSSSGDLSSFSGVFQVSQLSQEEQDKLRTILTEHSETEDPDIEDDFSRLLGITSEVKAINNQAAILHGERIKIAQEILLNYQEGAFSAWLIATYGNRQTPYNFLKYYELHRALPKLLHPKMEEMPRQALYTLASRGGTLDEKQKIIENYDGESKQEMLTKIRTTFPTPPSDKRSSDLADHVITHLKRLHKQLQQPHYEPTEKQKTILRQLLESLEPLTK